MDDYDDYDDAPRAVNLTEADEGCKLCDSCGGVGVTMTMVCYGGPPCERTGYCEDCDGDGQVELPAPPVPVRPQRVRDW